MINAEFYSSFEARSLDRMSELWEHSDEVRCTHPGWPTLKGWGAVSASFYNLFQSAPGLQFLLSDTDVRLEGSSALVFTTENLLGEAVGTTVSSLNVLRYDPASRGWKVIAHHASPVSSSFG